MDQATHITNVSVYWLMICLATLFILSFGCARLIFSQSKPNNNGTPQKGRDWTIPAIDAHAQKHSPFHNWDPRFKIVSLFLFWFCVASIQHLPLCLLAFLISWAAVWAAKIPLKTSMKRIAALSGFIGMFLIVMPLTVPVRTGDHLLVVDSFRFIQFNLRGFFIALRIGLKATAIALMMDVVLGTSPFPVTLKALTHLRVPNMICQMLSLAHRYIFVFHHEAKRMTTGMQARGFQKRTSLDTLKAMGNFIGMLFVRSFERTERVYDAMLARGYNGQFPALIEFHSGKKDWLKGCFWAIAGLALVISDRMLQLRLPFGA